MNTRLNNILIVFDATGCSPVSMQTVIQIASGLQADIQAVYIEDINLLNAVSLPFVREIALYTAEPRSINTVLMRQKLRDEAEEIKKKIAEIAFAQSVSLSFELMRGQKIQVIRSRDSEAGVVLIPAVYSLSGRKALHHLKHVAVVVYAVHSTSADNALTIAMAHTTKNNHRLVVVADSQDSQQGAKKIIELQGLQATYQLADMSRLDEIVASLIKLSPGLLVLTEDSPLVDNEKIFQQLINSLESDILLVR
ncbi:MAG: hypothetical protein OEY43_04570 [Gammaproteobacteria bacterium]|nr:hypothetical protein [Gammaproteobacteria bacterium]